MEKTGKERFENSGINTGIDRVGHGLIIEGNEKPFTLQNKPKALKTRRIRVQIIPVPFFQRF
jgi:hypothetical protein